MELRTLKCQDLDKSDEEKVAHKPPKRPTSFLETLTHLFKGNIGPGLFAMGDAFKNGGLIVSSVLTVVIGMICVHSQHILIKCSNHVNPNLDSNHSPDYAETVELCFEKGPKSFQSWSKTMKRATNIFICVTQLGFCCVYFVYISKNFKQVFDQYNLEFSEKTHMVFILLPILLPSLITDLKYLAVCSTLANVFMISSIVLTSFYTFQDLPLVSDRKYFSSWNQLPLFFGTAIFAFEGISLVLPLKNSMKKSRNFYKPIGVLNIGMTFVTIILSSFGFLGYLKFGDDVEASLTLNLPQDEILGQCVKIIAAVGVLLGYPLQFFIAIQIMWPGVKSRLGLDQICFGELYFRTLMVLLTFCIAEVVPHLGLFISLIGALCSTALALVFPPIIQLILDRGSEENGPSLFILVKNLGIILIAVIGFLTGSYESLDAIIKEFIRT